MTDVIIYLLSKTPSGETDEFAQPINTESRSEVMATSEPVTRSEFYSAGEKGIRPEYEFTINPAEYHGEEELEFTNEFGITANYGIYRTYLRNDDELEVYCSRSSGLNPKPAPEPTPTPTPEPTPEPTPDPEPVDPVDPEEGGDET